jgi:deazaflavin-dependent oxidoreductase (nitroreductase family)
MGARAGRFGPVTETTDFNSRIIEEFRANKGVVGGPFSGMPVLLLTTRGAKSGLERVNPLAALPGEDDVLYVFASKGGAPTNPDWYRNLVANSEVEVEYGPDRFRATATPVTGAERDRIYAEQASRVPAFADYQRNTDRVIPVVALRPRD